MAVFAHAQGIKTVHAGRGDGPNIAVFSTLRV